MFSPFSNDRRCTAPKNTMSTVWHTTLRASLQYVTTLNTIDKQTAMRFCSFGQ